MQNCPHCGQPLEAAQTASLPSSPKLGLTDTFWFGKYQTRTLQEVIIANPGYLLWADENVDGFDLAESVRAEARTRKANQAPRRRGWGSGYDDESPDWGELDEDIPF